MIITLTGLPGAGKSTIAKLLSEKLGWPWYSMGDLRGKLAQERGMTIDEFNALGEIQEFTDKNVDEYQTRLAKEQDNLVIDGRLSWHFIPHSLKVFLDVDEDEAAERIFGAAKKGLRKDEKPYASTQEVKQRVHNRLASDQKRYQQYYQLDYLDRSNYDLVIDTTRLNPEQIVQRILDKLKQIS
jgi:cytidylate kinase